ncbi:hypothetical protein CC86DRAFT_405044 [Ophiobolus disseminans]|uniref:Uncharacterized protein n=1 Tax=Ophiobolus disseminans TaxID=1469910 RepID=A0A6A7A5R9_9PLEO|nr:hypothetical protein CC86DRAFT_405044 [Ophiobolus disseminans]
MRLFIPNVNQELEQPKTPWPIILQRTLQPYTQANLKGSLHIISYVVGVFKVLFAKGAWINWLAFMAMCCYLAMILSCMSSAPGFVNLYTVEIKPSEPKRAVIKIGYIGICVQTPEMVENKKDWVCSRFHGNTTKGLDDGLVKLANHARWLQWRGLFMPPLFAAGSLFLSWVTFRLVRNKSDKVTSWAAIFQWFSCAIGFAATLIPVVLGNAMMIVGPIYHSDTQTRFSMGGAVLMATGFGLHLAYIICAKRYHVLVITQVCARLGD